MHSDQNDDAGANSNPLSDRTSADLLSTLPDALLLVNAEGVFTRHLGGAARDPVLAPAELAGKAIADVWPAAAVRAVDSAIRRVLKTRTSHTTAIHLQKDDQRATYEARLFAKGRDKVLIILRNIQERAVEELDASEPASTDKVTGLADRDDFLRHFDDVLADAQLKERGLAVMCIDIDRFSRFNDTLGRSVGDAILRVAAKRIERCLRDYDKLARIDTTDCANLTRISGDEFVLLLGEIEDRSDVATVASRVRDVFEEPIAIEGHELNTSLSIGIAQFPVDGNSSHDLLKHARVALEEAKSTSANGQEFYSDTMRFRALQRFDVKEELRWAIEREQLELHYLPRIDLATGHVAGVEALLRWMHPLRGSVPMSEVIPLAEATGLILDIGEWVIETACQQAAAWQKQLDDVPPISINLSEQEFLREDIVSLVEHAISENAIHPDKLELEITEHLLGRSKQADAIVMALDDTGAGIVLDDFGQGRSSAAHLTSLPIKAIKIDREFVEGAYQPGERQTICGAMIAMSRELGVSVIAEGVENELEVEFLRERGCDAVQGFLFTEPLTADKVPGFLETCAQVVEETGVIDMTTIRRKIAYKSIA